VRPACAALTVQEEEEEEEDEPEDVSRQSVLQPASHLCSQHDSGLPRHLRGCVLHLRGHERIDWLCAL